MLGNFEVWALMRMELLNWQELKKHSTKEKEKLTVYIKMVCVHHEIFMICRSARETCGIEEWACCTER